MAKAIYELEVGQTGVHGHVCIWCQLPKIELWLSDVSDGGADHGGRKVLRTYIHTYGVLIIIRVTLRVSEEY